MFREESAPLATRATAVKIGHFASPRSLRVVILNDSARMGGTERSLIYLVKGLKPPMFEAVVVCPVEGPLIETLRSNGIRVIPMKLKYFARKTKSSYSEYPTSLLDLYRVIKQLRPDILHCNSCRAAQWGIPLGFYLSVRTICQIRDMKFTKFTQFVLKHAPAKAEFIAISRATKNALLSIGVREQKINVIHNGEDTQFYCPQFSSDVLAREFPIIKNRLKIGMLGRIVEWKRHIDLIEAAGLLKDKLNLHVLIVGEPWDEESSHLSKNLEDRIRALGLNDRVTFTGFRNDVREIIAGLDIVAVPSDNEPFGRVVIEAMSMGKPVIGTRSGGIPEIIQDGVEGILVPVKDPKRLAKAIETLASDSKYAETLAHNARKRVVESFSVDSCVRKTREIYLQ